jgi:hypothetical protein
MDDDPVRFALRDPWSYLTGVCAVLVVQTAYLWEI